VEGEMVGEVEVIMDIKRRNFASSKTEVTLLMCKADYFLELLDKYPSVL
jgi:CRP-like cAMP-binding protein